MFIFKAKEYQSEKSPIFDSQKSTKTTRKLHIMSQLYAAKVCQLFCNTRYSDFSPQQSALSRQTIPAQLGMVQWWYLNINALGSLHRNTAPQIFRGSSVSPESGGQLTLISTFYPLVHFYTLLSSPSVPVRIKILLTQSIDNVTNKCISCIDRNWNEHPFGMSLISIKVD